MKDCRREGLFVRKAAASMEHRASCCFCAGGGGVRQVRHERGQQAGLQRVLFDDSQSTGSDSEPDCKLSRTNE